MKVLGSGFIKALRTSRRGSAEVLMSYEIRSGSCNLDWLYLIGGPTGYEAMPFNHLPKAFSKSLPWAACFGNDIYDKLDVPPEELRRVWDAHPELQKEELLLMRES